MGRKLYVGNLPYQTDETALQTLFAQAGNVESVSVVRDQATGRARGFAFVEMGSDEEAEAAINQVNGVELGGRALTVNEARPKTSGGGGGYGGGDSRRRSEPRWYLPQHSRPGTLRFLAAHFIRAARRRYGFCHQRCPGLDSRLGFHTVPQSRHRQ
jgi:cold-inducible RNA-binding protein